MCVFNYFDNEVALVKPENEYLIKPKHHPRVFPIKSTNVHNYETDNHIETSKAEPMPIRINQPQF